MLHCNSPYIIMLGYVLVILFSITAMATSISGVTFNMNGGRDAFKRYQLFEFLKRDYPNDFYLLQETHTLPQDEHMWKLIWRGHSIFSHGTSHKAGVAILFGQHTNVDIISQCDVLPGHILHTHVKIVDNPYHIINVYAPTNGVERMECFKKLKQHLNSLNDDPIIIGGCNVLNCLTSNACWVMSPASSKKQ